MQGRSSPGPNPPAAAGASSHGGEISAEMHPALRPYLAPLASIPDRFQLKNARPSTSQRPVTACCTRLDIGVRVLGAVRFSCGVVFDLADLSFPPEVVPPADLLLPDACASLNLQAVPSLAEWATPHALKDALEEIRALYKVDQRTRASKLDCERVRFDLSSLDHEQDLECVVEPHPSNPAAYKVLIRIPLPLPATVRAPTPSLITLAGTEASSPSPLPLLAHLTVTYHVSSASVHRIEKHLALPPAYADAYAPPLPEYPLNTTLLEYLMELDVWIKVVAGRVRRGVEGRKAFLEYVVAAFRPYVMEWDDEDYGSATFYVEVPAVVRRSYEQLSAGAKPAKTQGAVVNLHLSQDYPDVPPEIFLQSPTGFREPGSHPPETARLKLDWGKGGVAGVEHHDAVEKIRAALIAQIPTSFADSR
ncbi:hypothetical protein HDU86_004403 [Geranomyces michiganensis]|nr:hypothetical protein HDU86_004403 [Geranomyces michiganensis]